MKKNRMMRLASVLLIMTLLSTSVISGTFAKYVSTASGEDKARVAKWDIEYTDNINSQTVDITGNDTISFDLFNTIYEVDASTAEEHVAKGSDVMIIAPGTGGKFVLTVTNNSEVDARIKLDLAESAHSLPIEYSLDGSTYYANFVDINNTNAAIDLKYIAGGTNTKDITVFWRWAFVGSESTNYTSSQTDETDTAAGVAAQDADQTITITAKITAEQID